MVAATTAGSPDENVTSGSRSIQDCGSALRYACAEARAIYLEAAAARLGVPAATLTITDGEIVGANGARSSYGALADDALLEREATAGVPPKDVSRHRIVGTPLQRLDLAQKIYGLPRFVHDLELPGMLHARVLRPPSPAAVLVALDDARARALPGVVAVLRDGSFVGVLAEREETALKALEALRQGASWQETQTLPDAAALGDWLKAQAAESQVIAERGAHAAAGAAVNPACALHPPLSRPRLDRALVRAGAMGCRGPARLEPQPGHLQSAHRSRAGVRTASAEHRRRACRRCRLLRPQRRRRRRLRCGLAGARRRGAAGQAAMDARGRTFLGALRPGDARRNRSRSRRGRRYPRLAP